MTDTGVFQFTVHVQSRASRTELAGAHGDALKIRLKAPPVDGQANDELVGFVAGILDVPRRQIEIRSGHTARRKVLRLIGVDPAEMETRVTHLMSR